MSQHRESSPPLKRAPAPLPDDDAVCRATAMARFILRRVGIAPLVPALAIAALIAAPSPAHAKPVLVRATALATARATILPSSARIERGRLQTAASGAPDAGTIAPLPTIRACDPVPHTSSASCRLIVYDLP